MKFKNFIGIFFILLVTACTRFTSTPSPTTSVAAPNPTAAQYNTQLGMGYLQQGDMERAKSKLVLALQQAPQSADTQGAMAYFLEETGDNKSAENYYQQAIAVNPKAGGPQNNYGTFLCRTGQYQAGIQHFLLAAQDPTYIKTAEAYENAGLCALQIPDDNAALGYFQRAIQQDPQRANSYLALGQLSFKEGNYPVAQQYFDHYVTLTPNLGPDALWLGIRLARNFGDNTTAGAYTLTLQSKYPNSVEYKQLLAAQRAQDKTKSIDSSL